MRPIRSKETDFKKCAVKLEKVCLLCSGQRNLKMVAAVFLRDVVRTAGGLATGCGAGVTTANRTRIWRCCARPSHKRERLCQCLCCGQCVQACPYDTLKLATLASGLSAGTPYFVARDIPCEMCE